MATALMYCLYCCTLLCYLVMDFSLHAPGSTAGLINTDTTPEYYIADV